MDKIEEKRGKAKNKFRQVLLVDGKPAPLYVDNPRTKVSVIVDGKTHRLGYMSSVLVDLLKRIPGAVVETEIVDSSKTVGLRTVRGLHIRKSGANTTIEVSAPTEEALATKVAAVTTEMEENGTKITQRCSWICVADQAHPEPDSTDDIQEVKDIETQNLIPEQIPTTSISNGEHTKSEANVPTPRPVPKPASKSKWTPGRHGPGKPPTKKSDNTLGMKERMAKLRKLAVKKELVGVMPNTPPTDTDMHGN